MGELATRYDVSRLFARAAFGATAADLDRWTGKPYADVVSHLVDVPPLGVRQPLPDDATRIALEQTGSYAAGMAARVNPSRAQSWWLERMRTTPYPLEERMVLFWHDHFATGFGGPYPDVAMLLLQNETLREHALGNFRAMCDAMTLDPAMLWWLNGAESTGRKPNENFAREYFELFTLGTIPQIYSETDIREAARVFTGWLADPTTRVVRFEASRHDAGRKTVLGKTINNGGAREYLEVVNLALDQAIAPYFLAYKLVLNFAYVPATRHLLDDPDPLITRIAFRLIETGWDVREGVRELLLSGEFRDADPRAERQQVRQPIDLVVSAAKAVGVSVDTNTAVQVLRRMGQVPFEPPNVGGWPAGRGWLSPVTTLARYDWGVTCYNLWVAAPPGLKRTLPTPHSLGEWAAMFGLATLSANTTATIERYLTDRASAPQAERQAGVLALIASSPDWMVM